MTSSEVSLATGVGQWAAGRKVGLAATLAGRFPRLLGKVLTGQLATVNAAKVTAACDGLDDTACAAVDAVMADRVAGMDPARITTVARKVATRIAADQVAAATAKNKRDRLVQVSPGPDGTTDWWARLPADTSAAAWAAVRDLADQYAKQGPRPDRRPGPRRRVRRPAADQRHRHRQAHPRHPRHHRPRRRDRPRHRHRPAHRREPHHRQRQRPTADATTCRSTTGDRQVTTTPAHRHLPGGHRQHRPGMGAPGIATGGLGLGPDFSLTAALISGCEIPGIGFIDADTIETLLTIVPTDIGRALLDAHTGTLIESATHAYRPSKALTDFVTTRDGTCRMWGCNRPATTCDLDHARPWPTGPTTPTNLAGLCRRHHRLKQRRRWTYQLAPDGTATWTSPTGTKRTTQPDFTTLPPPPPPAATTTRPRPVDAGPPPF